jgi:hypothetical protein
MDSQLLFTLVGFVLTIMVFSYLFGDNILFRIASYLFVGVAGGYVGALVIDQVILPRLIYPLLQGSLAERILACIPLLLSALLLGKLSPRLARLGTIPMAYLVGVGAAIAVGGAVFGTLLGQIRGIAEPFNLSTPGNTFGGLLEGLILLIGAASTLVYFQFSATARPDQPPRRAPWIEGVSLAGQVFIGITLGALFAGVYAAAITALVERWLFIFTTIANFF